MSVYLLPIKLVSVANLREHWTAKASRTKRHRNLARFVMHAHAPKFPVVVTLTRIAPRALDDDNLASAAKAIRDGVADALGVKDNNPAVRWQYVQRKGKPREYGVEIRIEAA